MSQVCSMTLCPGQVAPKCPETLVPYFCYADRKLHRCDTCRDRRCNCGFPSCRPNLHHQLQYSLQQMAPSCTISPLFRGHYSPMQPRRFFILASITITPWYYPTLHPSRRLNGHRLVPPRLTISNQYSGILCPVQRTNDLPSAIQVVHPCHRGDIRVPVIRSPHTR